MCSPLRSMGRCGGACIRSWLVLSRRAESVLRREASLRTWDGLLLGLVGAGSPTLELVRVAIIALIFVRGRHSVVVRGRGLTSRVGSLRPI